LVAIGFFQLKPLRAACQSFVLEHFHKFCSHAGEKRRQAVFLIFGFVSAPAFAESYGVAGESQAAAGMLLRQNLAKASPKNQKSPLHMATVFLQTP
jgi:hypothetical protein